MKRVRGLTIRNIPNTREAIKNVLRLCHDGQGSKKARKAYVKQQIEDLMSDAGTDEVIRVLGDDGDNTQYFWTWSGTGSNTKLSYEEFMGRYYQTINEIYD